jgi:hypothetical protein
MAALQAISIVGENRSYADQTVLSQRISIIVLRQSSGKYDCHGWTTERTLPSLIFRLAISIALSEGHSCGTAKIGTRDEVSKFMVLLLQSAGVYLYRNGIMPSVR